VTKIGFKLTTKNKNDQLLKNLKINNYLQMMGIYADFCRFF